MEELLQFLNSVCPLSDALIDHLTQILRVRKLHRREYLLRAGHVAKSISFIRKGLLRCYYLKDDTEICSWFMKEGDVIVSVESFFQQKESYEFIQAVEESEIHSISYEQLQHIYKSFPEFNFIGRTLVEKYYVQSEQRLYSIRMQRNSERYEYLLQHHAELALRIPAKYIASYLGMTEVTFSRVKAKG